MSTARHHSEWLSLVEATGPFLSLPVLLEAFPQGLDAHEPEHLQKLRLAYEEWLDNQQGLRPEPAIHRAWAEWVLRQTLNLTDEVLLFGQQIPTGLQVSVAEHQESLRPDWAIANPSGTPNAGKPRLLVQLVPFNQDLDKPLKNARWKASPATRMMELLHGSNVQLGLVTNGERWMLVNAPRGETTSYISWYSNLWLEEHISLRAFRSLLGVRRFFQVEAHETLEALFEQSKGAQEEVTNQLGYQVRKAVEVLIQAWDRIDRERDRFVFQKITPSSLYEAALTIMMRLVFLLSAEEQKLILLSGDPLYEQHYAVSTLQAQLREVADRQGEEILQYRSDAWCRLLATFRAVYAGIQHDVLQLPAYGGKLFDPDRFPFLEGRPIGSSWQSTPADPFPVNNRTVLHLLEALQILQVKVPGGGVESHKLSFRALDIEQIGHVYEGLLDHTAVRATSPILGLKGSKEKEPEISLDALEALFVKGESELVKFLKAETGRSESALRKDLAVEISPRLEQRLRVACNNEGELYGKILPFVGLLRLDTSEYPTVIPTGSVYVTQGSDRRSTGTHYTPRSLTEPIVQYTLEPLVYEGVVEGKPKAEWQLRSAQELLQLKICDMAMGSGAFLVQVCRYLTERLVEAWEAAEQANPGQVVVAPEGRISAARPSECPIPKDADERIAVARRIITDRCLYGVDKNPMAVEMAKLSLWLITMQKNRPFTFLDHALRCGDSLLGVTDVKQIQYFHLNPKEGNQISIVATTSQQLLQEAIAKRKELESFTVNDLQDLQRKEQLLQEAEEALDQVRFIGDLLVGAALAEAGDASVLSQQVAGALVASAEERQQRIGVLRAEAQRMLDRGRPAQHPSRKTFHWGLEFPEVFLEDSASRGFAAMVGNPPFQGGKKISTNFGIDYRNYLGKYMAKQVKGSADFCAFFFLQAWNLLGSSGNSGLLATNTIAQGDTREVALDQLVTAGCVIYRAISSKKWPGAASLEVAHLWLRRGKWAGKYVLNEKVVAGITPFLSVPGKAEGKPHRLAANKEKSFQGSIVLGKGFILTPEEAQALIVKDSRNKDVLFPYLNGEDLNSRPDQSPSRWVINFHDWSLEQASEYPDCLKILTERVKPFRDPIVERGKQVHEPDYWKFWDKRLDSYAAIAGMNQVLVTAAVSPTTAFHFAQTGIVFAHKLIVFTFKDSAALAILQSSIHREWAYSYSSTLGGTTLNYSPSDCFETLPFPSSTSNLTDIGNRYYTHRQFIMQTRQEGLTKTYNRFHNPEETAADIQRLRELHIEMDYAVATAYDWTDLDLRHGFHETKQGLRYTISESARREVLDRLLQLNHQRYAEEVTAGLHDKGKKTKGGSKKQAKSRISPGQISLL